MSIENGIASPPEDAEQWRRRATEAASAGIWEYTPATMELNCTAQWKTLFGFPAGAAVTYRDWMERIHPGDREAAAEAMRKAVGPATGGEYVCESRILQPDGSSRWLLSKGQAAVGGVDRELRCTGITVDTTFAHGEDPVQAQRFDAQAQLAGGLAHDLNNLLAILNGHAGLALRRAEQETVRENLEQIANAGERAVKLTQQLLAFSQRQMLEPRPLNLNSAVQEMEQGLRSLAGAGVQLEITLAPKLAPVLVDSKQFEVVLKNLVKGAVDAVDGEGRLTIETRDVTVSDEPERYASLIVTNSAGAGNSSVNPSRLFEPYYSSKPYSKGARLGLAAVYGIVSQSGGRVSVSVGPDGTAFAVYLPAAAAFPREERSFLSTESSGGRETVLLVEDSTALREYVAMILGELGYTVLDVADGEAALTAARSRGYRIDLLISDMALEKGETTGPELASALCAIAPALRVLFISGDTEPVLLRHGNLGYQHAFLAKPFFGEQLASKVREVLTMPLPSRSVLLVDDDPQVRNLLNTLLRDAGYKVTVATDGSEAIAACQRQAVDLLLTDLIMPNREGLETIRHFKKHFPGVKIIAMSGSFDRGFLTMAGRLGAEAILQKPINPVSLIETVGKIIGKTSPESGGHR